VRKESSVTLLPNNVPYLTRKERRKDRFYRQKLHRLQTLALKYYVGTGVTWSTSRFLSSLENGGCSIYGRKWKCSCGAHPCATCVRSDRKAASGCMCSHDGCPYCYACAYEKKG
jgi:hypothetical protein